MTRRNFDLLLSAEDKLLMDDTCETEKYPEAADTFQLAWVSETLLKYLKTATGSGLGEFEQDEKMLPD